MSLQKRLFDHLDETWQKHPENIAIAGKRKGEWQSYTYRDFYEKSRQLSKALLSLGVKKGG